MIQIEKTVAARKVLKMMDCEKDGESRYQEFVSLVAEQYGITIEQLNMELDPFI